MGDGPRVQAQLVVAVAVRLCRPAAQRQETFLGRQVKRIVCFTTGCCGATMQAALLAA